MARPVWKGSISFGLVNIPIKLFSATESHRLSFHELEKGTHARIHHKRVSERTGKEVAWDDIESGYEIRKNQYVVLTDEELAAAEPRKSHTIDVETFVPLEEIDPINWDQTYYVAPDGEAAAKAYALLRNAMENKGRVAVGRFVLRTKEYVACVRPMDKVITLHTMFYPDEVRKPADLEIEPSKAHAGKQELGLAEKLIDMLAGSWEPSAHKDSFKERVLELIHKKDRGEEIEAPEEAEPTKVVDLMEALKASLEEKDAKKGKRRDEPKRATAAAHRATSRRSATSHRTSASRPRAGTKRGAGGGRGGAASRSSSGASRSSGGRASSQSARGRAK